MLHRGPLTVRCCVLLPRSIDRPRPRSHRYSTDRPTDRSRGRGLPRTCQGTRPNLSKNQKPSDMRGTAAPKSNALIAPVCRKMFSLKTSAAKAFQNGRAGPCLPSAPALAFVAPIISFHHFLPFPPSSVHIVMSMYDILPCLFSPHLTFLIYLPIPSTYLLSLHVVFAPRSRERWGPR